MHKYPDIFNLNRDTFSFVRKVGGWEGERFDGKGKERVTRNGKDPVIVETPEASSGGGDRPSGVEPGDFFSTCHFSFLEKEKGGGEIEITFTCLPPSYLLPSPGGKLCVCTAIRLL